ncbi:hypothetical protein [Mesorhizobium sp. M0019]|uniref:hypothetical protein n=1 Tax=Mesorhizobium sp. M0019 TaxID=2956845 RepID=UPI0033392D32
MAAGSVRHNCRGSNLWIVNSLRHKKAGTLRRGPWNRGFLACANGKELKGLARHLGIDDHQAADLAKSLEAEFERRSASECVAMLTKLNIGAVQPSSIAELREKYLHQTAVLKSGSGPTYRLVRHDIDAADRWLDLFEPCAIGPDNGHISTHPPAEKYGASTRQVLTELGFDEPRVEAMINQRAAAVQWSEFYLPE